MATKPEDLPDPKYLEEFYVRTAEFPAGFMTEYAPSMLVGENTHQGLATGYPVGKRFRSAVVRRVCDGNDLHLGHLASADGRWRIYVFAADASDSEARLAAFAEWLESSPDSPLAATPADADPDAWFDVKVIYPKLHTDVDITKVPLVFRPRVGKHGLFDDEKVFAIEPTDEIFEQRGIDRGGVVVVVRPDHYVSHVLPLSATDELAEFFRPLLPVRQASTA
jgi:phenol 2-monooxygenase